MNPVERETYGGPVRDIPLVGSPFYGKHREARVQRFNHRNLTAKARHRKKARRHLARAGRKANRK